MEKLSHSLIEEYMFSKSWNDVHMPTNVCLECHHINDVMRESMTSQQLIINKLSMCVCVCVCVCCVCVLCVWCGCVCVVRGGGRCVCTVCATSILTTAFLYKRTLHKVINSFLIISIAKIHIFIIICFV